MTPMGGQKLAPSGTHAKWMPTPDTLRILNDQYHNVSAKDFDKMTRMNIILNN